MEALSIVPGKYSYGLEDETVMGICSDYLIHPRREAYKISTSKIAEKVSSLLEDTGNSDTTVGALRGNPCCQNQKHNADQQALLQWP